MSHLKVGDKAPDFSARNQQGKPISLSDYRGKKVILYFYPKDLTPGCTNEACDFRDNYESLSSKGFVVIGVSADDEKSHQKFIDKHSLPFNLIADTDKEVIKAYGAWGEKKFMGKTYDGILRSTFVIDEEGTLAAVINKVETKTPTQQVLAILN